MSDSLRDRVDSMRSWALSRIRQCRLEEVKFSRPSKPYGGRGPAPSSSDVPAEARAERAALESVLERLGCPCRHDFGAGASRVSDFDRELVRCVVCGVPAPSQPRVFDSFNGDRW